MSRSIRKNAPDFPEFSEIQKALKEALDEKREDFRQRKIRSESWINSVVNLKPKIADRRLPPFLLKYA